MMGRIMPFQVGALGPVERTGIQPTELALNDKCVATCENTYIKSPNPNEFIMIYHMTSNFMNICPTNLS